ncbi:MAG: cytochrome c biogenesis protein ResB [Lentisphaerae bacterium]|nr:cytochrome c biogenesis protein ResB [Lentisphaerota bacterium]
MKKSNGASCNPSARLFDFLTSMKFALLIVFLIALACAVGTLLPQGAEVADYLQHNPAATGRMELFAKLGLTNVFFCWWFLALLGILSGNLLVCVSRRLFALRRSSGLSRLRIAGTALVHLSLLAIFLGGLIRGLFSERGFIEFREGESVTFFSTETGRVQLPFAVQLLKFEIERYPAKVGFAQDEKDVYSETLVITWPERKFRAVLTVEPGAQQVVSPKSRKGSAPESFQVSIVRRVTDFVIDTTTREITSRSDELRNPAILVRVSGAVGAAERWVFARYPDDFNMPSGSATNSLPIPFDMNYEVTPARKAPIKAFKSSLRILDDQAVRCEKTIEVNAPLSFGGYTFYQSGYDEKDPTWTSLQVVRDPGVSVVYLGFALMTLGLLLTTYVRVNSMG